MFFSLYFTTSPARTDLILMMLISSLHFSPLEGKMTSARMSRKVGWEVRRLGDWTQDCGRSARALKTHDGFHKLQTSRLKMLRQKMNNVRVDLMEPRGTRVWTGLRVRMNSWIFMCQPSYILNIVSSQSPWILYGIFHLPSEPTTFKAILPSIWT